MFQELIGKEAWEDFRSVMSDAHSTFNQKEVVWIQFKSILNKYGEDIEGNAYTYLTLEVLCNYNYMRTWPITFNTDTGANDRQSIQLFINKDYLRTKGLLDPFGRFKYNKDTDQVILDGQTYTVDGDTPASQAHDDDIFFTVILKVEETSTA